VTRTSFARISVLGASLLALVSAACGEYVRGSRSPSQIVVTSLEAASGADPEDLGVPLSSDVVTNLTTPEPCSAATPCPTFFNDLGSVTMSLILRNPGQPGLASEPSAINQVTFNRYRVEYTRADGRNTPGVDVPYPFDGAVTFTVPTEGTVTAAFELVRHSAKLEAPLLGLRNRPGAPMSPVITTIATVTFFGRDQAGNDVQASATIQVNFGDFADQ
jgi:hypothetical protein